MKNWDGVEREEEREREREPKERVCECEMSATESALKSLVSFFSCSNRHYRHRRLRIYIQTLRLLLLLDVKR